MGAGDDRRGFGIDTAAVGSIERATAWCWPAEERTGAPPIRQYTGPGEDTLALRGVIYPDFRGGLGQVDAMREMAGRGAALRLVDGWSGRDRGLWAITRIRETVAASGRTAGRDARSSCSIWPPSTATKRSSGRWRYRGRC